MHLDIILKILRIKINNFIYTLKFSRQLICSKLPSKNFFKFVLNNEMLLIDFMDSGKLLNSLNSMHCLVISSLQRVNTKLVLFLVNIICWLLANFMV